jgi:hypothetical protein
VLLFSILTTSVKAMINYDQQQAQPWEYIRYPSEDVAIEANVVFRHIHASLHEDFF